MLPGLSSPMASVGAVVVHVHCDSSVTLVPSSFLCFTYVCTCLLGIELLATFERELVQHEKKRQELANAEKLFDLPITMYPELLKVQKEMSGLKVVYELYRGLKASVPADSVSLTGGRSRSGPADSAAPTADVLGRCPRTLTLALRKTADGYRVSVWEEEKVLEQESGDGHIAW